MPRVNQFLPRLLIATGTPTGRGIGMANIAKQIKEQTDSILRRRQVSPGSSMTVRGGATTPGTGPGEAPEVIDPNRDLSRHKTSGDHDGRYYTEAEVDAIVASLTFANTYRQTFDNADIVEVSHNLGRRPIVQSQGSVVLAYGAGNYGADAYGGISPYTVLNPLSIEHSLDSNKVVVKLPSKYTGEVICVG